MPQYIGYSPWADAANVGRGLGATLTDILINLPRLRQQMALSNVQQDYYRANAERERAAIPYERARAGNELAQTGLYNAQAEYHRARTGEIGSVERAKENLGNALRQIPTTAALGGSLNPLISDAVDNLARLPSSDRSGLAETLAQMLEMGNPRYRQALGLGQSMLSPVSAEGSLYNAITQQHEGERGIKLGYGQRYVDPRTGDVMAQGAERPLSAENWGGVYTGLTGAVIENPAMAGLPPERVTSAVAAAINQLRSELGGGLPQPTMRGTNAPTAVPQRRVRKFNPATGRLED